VTTVRAFVARLFAPVALFAVPATSTGVVVSHPEKHNITQPASATVPDLVKPRLATSPAACQTWRLVWPAPPARLRTEPTEVQPAGAV
jgi:hypothetical protein